MLVNRSTFLNQEWQILTTEKWTDTRQKRWKFEYGYWRNEIGKRENPKKPGKLDSVTTYATLPVSIFELGVAVFWYPTIRANWSVGISWNLLVLYYHMRHIFGFCREHKCFCIRILESFMEISGEMLGLIYLTSIDCSLGRNEWGTNQTSLDQIATDTDKCWGCPYIGEMPK